PATSDPLTFEAGVTEATVTPAEAENEYSLVAVAGDQRSAPASVHVSTHPDGHVYSPHAHLVASAQPEIIFFKAYPREGGREAAADTIHLAPGARGKLFWEVSGNIASITLFDGSQVIDVTDITDDKAGDDDAGIGEYPIQAPSGSGPWPNYKLSIVP